MEESKDFPKVLNDKPVGQKATGFIDIEDESVKHNRFYALGEAFIEEVPSIFGPIRCYRIQLTTSGPPVDASKLPEEVDE